VTKHFIADVIGVLSQIQPILTWGKLGPILADADVMAKMMALT
jgi:hypothetical protein